MTLEGHSGCVKGTGGFFNSSWILEPLGLYAAAPGQTTLKDQSIMSSEQLQSLKTTLQYQKPTPSPRNDDTPTEEWLSECDFQQINICVDEVSEHSDLESS